MNRLAFVLVMMLCMPLAIMPAVADDYTLGIYGNANMDNTIDDDDVAYVEGIIAGTNDETELADANYDDDIARIGQIIRGEEKELTIVQYIKYYWENDTHEEPVTIPMPIESIAAVGSYQVYTLCALGEQDKIVAGSTSINELRELSDLIEEIPEVGANKEWDLETILELNPDIVLSFACYDYSEYREIMDTADIPLIQMDLCVPERYSNELRNLGWILNKQERAEELISFEQQHLGLIEERVKDLDEEQKPRVY